jgi:DNA-binding transcriptional MerR regulator
MPEPGRTPGGHRNYGEDAVERLRFIRDAQATGLSLAKIQSIFDLRAHGEQTCHHVMELLEQHVAAIDRQALQLRTTRKLLVGMLERAQQLDPSDCVDPNRCQTIARDDAGQSARAVRSGVPARHVHG